jgi:hypothetical protein
VVRLGWRIGKNGLWHWVGAEMRDVMNIYIYRLTAGNLTKRAKRIYKNVSSVQNLIFKRNLFEFK